MGSNEHGQAQHVQPGRPIGEAKWPILQPILHHSQLLPSSVSIRPPPRSALVEKITKTLGMVNSWEMLIGNPIMKYDPTNLLHVGWQNINQPVFFLFTLLNWSHQTSNNMAKFQIPSENSVVHKATKTDLLWSYAKDITQQSRMYNIAEYYCNVLQYLL